MNRRSWLVWTTVILSLGMLFRGFSITQGLWLDEVVSAENARRSLAELMSFVVQQDVVPPLYYLALKGWGALFGTSDLALRSMSLLFSLVTGLALLAWTRARGAYVQLLVLLLLMTSALHIHYSVEVRPFGLALMLGVLLLLQYERLSSADRSPAWRWGLFLVTEVALLYTHLSGILLVIPMIVHYGTVRTQTGRDLLRWTSIQGTAIGLFSFWLPVLISQWSSLGRSPSPQESLMAVGLALRGLGLSPVHPSIMVSWTALFLLAIPATWTAYKQFSRSRGKTTGRFVIRSLELTPSSAVLPLLALALLIVGPALSLRLFMFTGIAVSSLEDHLDLCYFITFATVTALLIMVVFNRYLCRRGHGAPIESMVLLVMPAVLLILSSGRVPLIPADLLIVAPVMGLLAAQAVRPVQSLSRFALAAFVLAAALPSVVLERESFLPRADMCTLAESIRKTPLPPDEQANNVVLPLVDRPALEYYLGPYSAIGILGMHQLPSPESLPYRLNVVLTREAYESSEYYSSMLAQHLGSEYNLSWVLRVRQAVLLQFDRVNQTRNP